MTTNAYVVVAQVGGFTRRNRDRKLKTLEREAEARIVDRLLRDDGTAELCFEWHPDAESDGTKSFQESKESLEAVRSAVTGAALTLLNPIKVERREVALGEGKAPAVRKAPARKAAASSK